jgi:hypothetical protein
MPDSLFIKYKPTDTGARPIPSCGSGEIPWLSTAIDIVPGPAQVGVACQIRVRVDSKTVSFPGGAVKVQVWVCDYTGGVGPSTATAPPYDPVSGDASSGGPTIVAGTVTPGAPPGAQTVAVPWTPKATELRNPRPDGSFHMCVAANVFSDDPVAGIDGASLGVGQFLNLCGNQHHAQKNLSILPAAAPGGGGMFPFMLGIGAEEDAIFELEAREVRRERFELAELKDLAALVFVELPEGFDLATLEKLHASGEEVELLLAGERARVHEARGPAGPFELEAPGQKGHRVKVEVPAGRPQTVRLRVRLGKEDEPGAVHAFDIVQRFASGKHEGRLAGGARALLVFAPNAKAYAAEE